MSLAILRGHMQRVKPPRTLLTRFPRGQTTGPAGDVAAQRAVVGAALDLLAEAREGGEIREFDGA